jgi:protein phosphatase 1 regulatory subunit 32
MLHRHFDMNPKGKDREGYDRSGINGARDNSYTQDVRIHDEGKINTSDTLQNIQSFQAR